MCGGTALCIEVDLHRIERRLETGYLDERAADLDDALSRLGAAAREGRPLSIGLLGEMMTRTYFESQGKPPYMVRTTLNVETPLRKAA